MVKEQLAREAWKRVGGDGVKGEGIGARERKNRFSSPSQTSLTIGRGANMAPEVALSLLRAQSGRQLFPVAPSLLYDTASVGNE